MSLTVFAHTAIKELGKIEDVDASFVSLVKYGANRQGFRIVKGEKMKLLQSILLPKTLAIEELQKKETWLSSADVSTPLEHGEFIEFTQAKREKFKADTLTMHPLGKTGAFVVGGVPKHLEKLDAIVMPAAMGDMPVMTPEEAQEAQSPPSMPMMVQVSEDAAEESDTVNDVLRRELWAFGDMLCAAIKQSQMDDSERQTIFGAALSALTRFLQGPLFAASQTAGQVGQIAKGEAFKKEIAAIREKKVSLAKEDNKLFKSKEEMAEFITQTVKAAMKSEGAPAAPPDPLPAPPTTPVAQVADPALAAAIQVLTAKMEKMESLIPSGGRRSEPTQEQVQREKAEKEMFKKWEDYADVGVPKELRAGVFKGLFSGPIAQKGVDSITV